MAKTPIKAGDEPVLGKAHPAPDATKTAWEKRVKDEGLRYDPIHGHWINGHGQIVRQIEEQSAEEAAANEAATKPPPITLGPGQATGGVALTNEGEPQAGRSLPTGSQPSKA